MPATMATTDRFPWEHVSQVKDHPTMERLESTCDIGCYYAAKSTHLIAKVGLDDDSFHTSERTFLRKSLTDNGMDHMLLYQNFQLR
jgi:hypothetical protein